MDRLVPSWASRRGRPYLVRATEPNGRISEFHWSKGMDCVFIGRHSNSDLHLRQTDASRFHACLARDKHEDLYIVDLNSRAVNSQASGVGCIGWFPGTFVDGNRVKGRRSHRRIQIHPGESSISIGTNNATILTLLEKSEPRKDQKQDDANKKSHTNEHHLDDSTRVRNKREFQNAGSSDQISVHRKRKPYSPPIQAKSGPHKQDVNKDETTSAVRSGMTVEQKRQLLWGKKKEQQDEIAIRWDMAEFQTTEQRSKFQRLMGMKTADHEEEQPMKTPEESRGVLKGEAQDEVLQSVEKHFVSGLRRADGRTVGLGL